MTARPGPRTAVALAAALLMSLAALYWGLMESGALSLLADEQALRAWVRKRGAWGPVALIAMMVAAIVMSPIPSGPIAMVAGASYGPAWGTLYVVIGAETGALIAFAIARLLGYATLVRWQRIRPVLAWLGRERSQTGLMLVVFASRLVPFISFDAVSYGAGLTPLAPWRFVVATLAGVIPTAYLFVAFGDVLITADTRWGPALLILVSGVTLLPLLASLLHPRHWRRRPPRE